MMVLPELNDLYVRSFTSYDPAFITRYQPSTSTANQHHSSSLSSSTKPIPNTHTNIHTPVEPIRKVSSEGLSILQGRQGKDGGVEEGKEKYKGVMPAVTMSSLITLHDISEEVGLMG